MNFMQKYLNTTHRTVVWFKRAFDSGELVIDPPFQRNPVWSNRQKSALIETILLEYPIPELYMQELTTEVGQQTHIVVDGQQRVRAVLSFLAGEFELDEETPDRAGLSFDDLPPADRKRIFEYDFVVRLLPEMPNEELRSIFQRINRNTVTLNQQELRHATYWGPFIKLMEEIADLEFWSWAGVFSANDRRRMLDVEFVSELAVAVLNGLQNKKKNLEEFYQLYETSFEQEEFLRSAFLRVLGEIDQLLPDISKTRWRKKSDFYTLFLKLSKHLAALPLASDVRERVSAELTKFSSIVDRVIRGNFSVEEVVTDDIWVYVNSVEGAASDFASRKAREEVLDFNLTSLLAVD